MEEMFYDVCFLFDIDPSNKIEENSKTINGYKLKIFSNSPHFVFTYAYVCYKRKIIIEDLVKTKYNAEAIKKEPKTTNPHQIFGFEKTTYFAALYMKELGLNYKINLDNYSTNYIKPVFLSQVKSFNEKLKEYNAIKSYNKNKDKANNNITNQNKKLRKAQEEKNKELATQKINFKVKNQINNKINNKVGFNMNDNKINFNNNKKINFNIFKKK